MTIVSDLPTDAGNRLNQPYRSGEGDQVQASAVMVRRCRIVLVAGTHGYDVELAMVYAAFSQKRIGKCSNGCGQPLQDNSLQTVKVLRESG
jgi:hypothetical protein